MDSPGPNQQHYCLRWHNFQSNMSDVFQQLLRDEAFVDVTLACQEQSLRAHKVVLSACSPYIQRLLLENECRHPVVVMPREIGYSELRGVIEFAYRGEVDVAHAELPALLRAAEILQVRGLCEVAARHLMSNRPPNVKYSTFRRPKMNEEVEELTCCYPEDEPPHLPLPQPEILVRTPEESNEKTPRHNHESPENSPQTADKSTTTARKRLHEDEDDEDIDVNANNMQPKEPMGAVAVQPRVREDLEVKLEMRGEEHPLDMAMEPNHSDRSCTDEDHTMMITPELLGLIPISGQTSDLACGEIPHLHHHLHHHQHKTTKHWSQEDMELALEALRSQSMNLTKASATFGIPSTTLWQRAHRLGINTPKKESQTKTWSETDLNHALEELRAGRISANRASKTFHIPSSTLYKIARKEGIKLSAPFNACPTTWNSEDLNRALEAIRNGASVQKASTEFGIPSGTLYGRCKREGIELSKSTPVPWSSNDMTEALDAVRGGEMSINQAAIHYNLPYSSLYGRFKRVKFEDGTGKVDFESYNSACSNDH